MAKNSIRDYSATNSNNTDIQSIDIGEGCAPAGINNAIREVMADLKDVSTGTIALESPKFDSILDGNIKATDASGTDAAGTATTIKGGAGTGTGDGGSIVFQVADGAGSTGSSVNAHATAMTIADDSNVGIGTSSPTNGKLEVTHSSSTVPAGFFRNTSGSGDSPSLTVQGGANNAAPNFSVLDYNGNTDFVVQGSGNLLVNNTSGIDSSQLAIQLKTTTNAISVKAPDTSSYMALQCINSSNSRVGYIQFSTTSTVFSTSSDYRLKENVTADWDATTRLKQLNPVRFNFIVDPNTTVDGFLAHEVQDVVPEAISGTKDAVDDEGNPVYQGIDQSKLVPLLVKTIQELEARITALETA